jgi:hypothetical protein
MPEQASKRLSVTEALVRATDCRELARNASNPEHKTLLEQMAETWERIAKGLTNGHGS